LDWVFLVTSILLCCEVLRRVPLASVASDLLKTTNKIFKTLSSTTISDHWKEAVVPQYAKQAGYCSIQMLLYLLLVASPLVLFMIFDKFVELGLDQLVVRFEAMAVSTAIAVTYLKVRAA
jgi:hypothetical protein